MIIAGAVVVVAVAGFLFLYPMGTEQGIIDSQGIESASSDVEQVASELVSESTPSDNQELPGFE